MFGPKIGDNSFGIQARRDVVIGLTYSDVKEIVYDLFKQNFPLLVSSASEEAKKNVDEYVAKLEDKLQREIDRIDLQKFTKPNTQYVLNESIRNYAKKGNKIDIDVLTEALIASLQKDSTEMLDIVSEQVLEIIPKLTIECHQILTLSHYLLHVKIEELADISGAEKPALKLMSFLNLEKDVTELIIRYMESLGLLSINQFVGLNIYEAIKNQYSEFGENMSIEEFTNEVNSKCPSLSRMSEYFEKYHLGTAALTPSGMLIALINLKKTLGPIDYKIWIK